MTIWKMIRSASSFSWPLVLCLSHFVFMKVSEATEPGLVTRGHLNLWWAIVLIYWLVDATITVCSIAVFRWPIYPRSPDRVSFLVLSSEIAIAMLFLHLAWLTKDYIVDERLKSIGLGGLTQFFLVIMSIWVLVVILKYERLNRDDKVSRIKWPAGRRTTIVSNLSNARYRDRAK